MKITFDKDHTSAKDYFLKFLEQEIIQIILDSVKKYIEILPIVNRSK